MKRWRLLLIALAAIVIVAIGIRHVREKGAQRKREVAYQLALRSYSTALRPGMKRTEVEDYLRTRNVLFRQMCCVDRKDLSYRTYDDLTKIGEEGAPWFCNEKNIYVAFQFAASESHQGAPTAGDSDRLRAVTIFPWLEECL